MGPVTALVGPVAAVMWSPDGRELLIRGADHLRILDSETGTVRRLPRADRIPAWSPNGQPIALYGNSYVIELIDPLDGATCGVPRGHEDYLFSVARRSDGAGLLSVSRGRAARVWDTSIGRTTQVFRGHKAPVTFGSSHPGGDLVATCSLDRSIGIWSAQGKDFRLRMELGQDGVHQVLWSPDGNWLATTGFVRIAI